MFNYHAPFCQVRIANRQNKEWIFDIGNYPFVQGVVVTVNLSGAHDGITLTIEAPYDEGLALIEEGAFDFMNLVSARMGYLGSGADSSGGVTPWFYGFLAEGANGLKLDPDGLSGSVNAKYEVRKNDHIKVLGPGEGGKTVAQLFEEHANAMGFVTKAIDGAAKKIEEISTLLQHDKKKVKWLGVDPRMTHWEIIKTVLDFAGCEFYIGTSDVTDYKPNERPTLVPTIWYMLKDNTSKKGKPERIYAMRGLFDPLADPPQFPILEMSYTASPVMFGGGGNRNVEKPKAEPGAGKTQASYVDLVTGKFETVKKEGKDVPRPGIINTSTTFSPSEDSTIDGVKADAATDGETTRAYTMSVPAHGGPEAKAAVEQKVISEMDRQGDNYAVKLMINAMGSPLETPSAPVYVEMAGSTKVASGKQSPWGGPYQVMRVTHTYSNGKFDTGLLLQRWGNIGQSNVAGTQSSVGNMPEAK
jgi:hypothetical protein